MTMAGSVTLIVFSAVITVLSIFMLTGRGSFLIAGFNTMSSDEKARYNKKALCRLIGSVLLPTGLFMPFFLIDSIIYWFVWAYCAVVIGTCVFVIIYVNTSKRFKK